MEDTKMKMTMNKSRIDEWFIEAYITNNTKESYDLHIDEIYPGIKKNEWISRSLEVLQFIFTEKERICQHMDLELFIPLANFNLTRFNNIKNLIDLPLDLLDQTPPSFYLLDTDTKELIISKSILLSNFTNLPQNSKLYLREYIDPDWNEKDYYLRLIIE